MFIATKAYVGVKRLFQKRAFPTITILTLKLSWTVEHTNLKLQVSATTLVFEEWFLY